MPNRKAAVAAAMHTSSLQMAGMQHDSVQASIMYMR